MDTLLNELADEHETKETIWIYKDKKELYNKYNQINISSVIQEIKKENPLIIKEEKIEIKKEIIKRNKEEIKGEIKEDIKEDIKEQIKEDIKEQIKEDIKEENKEEDKKIKRNKKEETPLDLIIKYTSSALIVKNEIKQKLIEFITVPEFAKAFGVKKSAEIISALTRDGWNQSIALFISFLLDANVIYKNKSYIFNKNKILKDISIFS